MDITRGTALTPSQQARAQLAHGGRHVLLIVAGLVFASAFFYWAELGWFPVPAIWQDGLGTFIYYEIGMALFAVPVVHAAVVFRLRGAVAASLVAVAVVLPHVLAFDTYPTPFSELFSLLLLGILVSIVLNSREHIANARDTLEQFVSGTLQAQELERLYFSRELHDETAQDLVDVLHEIDAIQDTATASPEVREKLATLRRSVEGVLDGTRRLMEGLRPPELDELGLVPALRWLCEEARDESGVRCEFSAEGAIPDLPRERGLAVYRMAQEGLTNARRHAEASNIEVALAMEDGKLHLSITDDGKGFPVTSPDALVRHGKYGLVGLTERARLLGGSARIRSSPGEGTAIVVELPLG